MEIFSLKASRIIFLDFMATDLLGTLKNRILTQ